MTYQVNNVTYCLPNSTEVLMAIVESDTNLDDYPIKVISVKGPYLATRLVPIKKAKKVSKIVSPYALPENIIKLRDMVAKSNFHYRGDACELIDRRVAIIYAKAVESELPIINNTEFKRQFTILLDKHKRFKHRTKIKALLDSVPTYY